MSLRDEGFLRALQEEPEDDALRLIYADFLDDRGDPSSVARAELIRVQVELTSSVLTPDRADALTQRERVLLAGWARKWLGDWADVLEGWTFRRGFVEGVWADASVFLDHAADWFADWPTLAVARLTRAAGHLPELAESPWLAHLRGLDLSDNDIDADALESLMASRFLCLLQALDLSDNPIGPRGAALIATAPALGDLRELRVARCGLGSKGLADLLGWRSRLWRRLDLAGNGLERRDLVQLVEAAVMRNLAALELAGNPLGENGAAVLADSPNVGGLVDLGLCATQSGNAAIAALASSPHLPALRSLDIRCHHCVTRRDFQGRYQGGLADLAQSPLLGQLRRLLLTTDSSPSGWVADMLRVVRPPRRQLVQPDWWAATLLRTSRYLMPSQLAECDVEELWWLGNREKRERLPSLWAC
jgi:uncharacterized protein (TIGR02996 family)